MADEQKRVSLECSGKNLQSSVVSIQSFRYKSFRYELKQWYYTKILINSEPPEAYSWLFFMVLRWQGKICPKKSSEKVFA